MKRINKLLIILTILMLSSISAHAWDISSKDLGMSFTISNNWIQSSYVPDFPIFINTQNSTEKISFEIYYSEKHELDIDEARHFCNYIRYSAYGLSKTLTNLNNITVDAVPEPYWDRIVEYNGITYYNYIQPYTAEANGYSKMHGLKSAFITFQNGKGYLIEYSIFTDDPTQIKPVYETAEIFNLLNTLSFKPGEIGLYINNQKISSDTPPILIENRTLVPVRVIAEHLNYNVEWNPDIQTIVLTPNSDKDPALVLKIGEASMLLNYNEQVPLELAPQIINNRTYLPVRAVGLAMNAFVDWDNTVRAIVMWK